MFVRVLALADIARWRIACRGFFKSFEGLEDSTHPPCFGHAGLSRLAPLLEAPQQARRGRHLVGLSLDDPVEFAVQVQLQMACPARRRKGPASRAFAQ